MGGNFTVMIYSRTW